MSNFLFAIDTLKEEVIVSESPKETKIIQLIERIPRHKNNILYMAVETLTAITQSKEIDSSVFKAMDKVCQLIYCKK